MNDTCVKCDKKLSSDEIGIYKKLVNRGAQSFFCIQCLAKHFDIREELIYEKIEYYKKQGCTLLQ